MRLLLIAPARNEALVVAGKRMSVAPPLSLAMVAALTPKEWDVKIVDENVEELDYDEPTDLVGITATTRTAKRAYEIAQRFRSRAVPTVLGGIHPSTLPEEGLQSASAVVIGEAEASWPLLLRDFANGTLQPIYQEPRLAEMADLPVPRRDLFRKSGYFASRTLFTTRGCPYACAFCTVTTFFGRTYRLRPVENVLNEINDLPGEPICFLDDNIVGNPAYAKQLFKALIPRKIKWLGQASLAIARDQELLRLAAASGCGGLYIGFESTDRDSLESMGKKANLTQDYEQAVKLIHSHGIYVFGSFIFGFDTDDESVFERTVSFARKAHLEGAQFHILTPYPGTSIHAELEQQGRLLTKDWDRYNMTEVVFVPKRMTAETLINGQAWAWREFYSVPSIIERLSFKWHHMALLFMLNVSYRRHWYGKTSGGEKPHLITAPSEIRLP